MQHRVPPSPNRPPRPPAVDRLIFFGRSISIGEFRCPSNHPAWSSENHAERTIAVFPRLPVRITQAGRESLVADPNTVVFYNAGQPYRRALLSDHGDECEFFAVHPNVIRDIAATLDPSTQDHPDQPFIFDHGPADSRAYFHQRLLYLNATRAPAAPFDPLLIEEGSLTLIARLMADTYRIRAHKHRLRTSTARSHARTAEAVKHFLHQTMPTPPTLDHISDAVELSPFHACRLFRAHTGIPIHRYALRLRLRAALEHLSRGTITTTAFHFGFASHAHFTGAFHREFGFTPSLGRALVRSADLSRASKIMEDHKPSRR